ncbi:MAG: MAPEG family protein [Novosphingobium sp.]
MAVELRVLAYGAILLLVHILLAGHFKTKQYGIGWNMGARDEELPPMNALAGRLARAQANFMETFPIAIVALGGVVLAGKTSQVTAMAAWVWLGARVLYLPLYWAGVPRIRTLVWMAGTISLLAVLWALVSV